MDSHGTVVNKRNKYFSPHTKCMTEEQIRKVFSMLEAGSTAKEIATDIGFTTVSVLGVLYHRTFKYLHKDLIEELRTKYADKIVEFRQSQLLLKRGYLHKEVRERLIAEKNSHNRYGRE